MLHPNQFQVNQAWIATRLNDQFLYVAGEPADLYMLLVLMFLGLLPVW